ncbi:MAG: isoleucine--tRNA ligase [Spirochaetia bacterium]|nr:isoleucine--tRNA ligase [Spirochaetia bacterium]
MSFPEFSSRKSVSESEQEILSFWKKENLFKKCINQNKNGPLYVFFEGPPTANGKPGIHHVLSRVFKDIYIRFYTQKGYKIPRMGGWDCHGLPVEREVEKQLGIKTKSEIEEKYGLKKFNQLCRKSVLQYVDEWKSFSERLGFWIDLEKAYFTMDNHYIESVWSLLKIIWEKDLIYQGYRVVPFDPVMGATMSDAEVALGYKTVDDPSVTVRFKIQDLRFANTSFLVWTTTPWTLPSNVALALSSSEEYCWIEREDGERLIVGGSLCESIMGDEPHKILETLSGGDLAGISYEPLFNWVPDDAGKKKHYTIHAEFVTMDAGTGIVHIAPSYGADDLEAGQKHDLPVLYGVGLDGKFIHGPLAGKFFKDADPEIIRDLKERGLLWKSEKYRHEYPFGWRTGAPLLYYAKDAWYIRTTKVRNELIRNNAAVNWVPDHIKEGRFGKWLENNRDWALSRERYWGTPLPVWTDGEGNYDIIGSVKELEKLSGKKLTGMDLHRPFIDSVTYKHKKTGKKMKRVPEVIDCWFDSGAMPYAQWGWPVRGKKEFEEFFPADFISEAVDQTRGWFYTLLAISTMVSGKASYKNVVCLGHVLDAKGEKMSKSKGNTVNPNDVFSSHGADAIRWYFLTGAPAGNSRRVGNPGNPNDPVSIVHGFFNMLKNSAGFFAMYANVDGIKLSNDWENPIAGAPTFKKRPEIDRWILSSLQILIRDVDRALTEYDSQKAGRLIEGFADSLSNWYIRRNRRRFWKGELDKDKLGAYDTLHRCLVTLVRLTAPFAPFASDEIFRNLVSFASKKAPKSVHISGWPKADFKKWYDETMLHEGNTVQNAAELGRAARMQSGVKVRQPLSRLMIHVNKVEDRSAIEKNREVLLEELNVKELEFLDDSAGIIQYRIKPNLPRIGKSLGPRVREVQEFLKTSNPAEIALKTRAGETIQIGSNGNAIELEPEDFIIESLSKEGSSAAEGNGLLVALDTQLSEELILEGLVRDLIRNIQELRKKSGLNVTDRIQIYIEGSEGEFARAVEMFRNYVEGETLSAVLEKPAKGKPSGEDEITLGENQLKIFIWKELQE